jgi:hypothetical protein
MDDLAGKFRIDEVINGLVDDLNNFRAGKISNQSALTRAELAKQIMNGFRIVLNAQSILMTRAKPIKELEKKA